MERIREEMKKYYHNRLLVDGHLNNKECDEQFKKLRDEILEEVEEFYSNNKNASTAKLKSRLHKVIAEKCEPMIFPECPFYYEIGMRKANSWGRCTIAPSNWIRKIRSKERKENYPIIMEIEKIIEPLFDYNQADACSIEEPFDTDHHTIGYRDIFALGISGIINKVKDSMKKYDKDSLEYDYLSAMLESCDAILLIAEKFSELAKNAYLSAKTEKERESLKMIAETAKRIPYNPPKTFYEGLEMIIFIREITATLENIGISSFGQMDMLLGKLYEDDIKAGRITEERARELIGIWFLYTDIKFNLEKNKWPETSTCLQLGGCDSNGKPIYNHVTKMIIEEHHRIKVVNPKLNCRVASDSPIEYLEIIGKSILSGHNNFVLINDNIIIDGLVKNGVELTDARAYVNGGCQETMIEGCGHTEGAAVYVSMAHVLDAFMFEKKGMEIIKPLENADNFESFYSQFMTTIKRFLAFIFEQRNIREYYFKNELDCPLFSTTQKGCIESGTDYSHGGAKYNFSTVALVGLATVVDSLYAIKNLVYDEKKVTLLEITNALKNNWEGYEELRLQALDVPKYGHADKEVDELANRYLTEISEFVCSQKNERGGYYIPSLFVYYYFQSFCHTLRATADGRRNYDLISPGCSPSQLVPVRDATIPIQSFSRIDFTVCGGGNAVFDLVFPVSKQMNEKIFASFIRASIKYGCPTIQPNFLKVEDLIDAKVNPDKHKDIIVRVSGLSAYFVALRPEVQDEIISRNIYNA